MKLEKYVCGLCGKKFDGPSEVSNEVSGRNGKWHFFADDVCDACVGKFGKFIEELGGELKTDDNRNLTNSQSG